MFQSKIKNITYNKVKYSRTNFFQYRINQTEWWIAEILSKIQSSFFQNENVSINFYPLKEEYYEYNRSKNKILIVQKALETIEIRKKYFEYDLNGVNIIAKKNDLLHQETYKSIFSIFNRKIIIFLFISEFFTINSSNMSWKSIKIMIVE